MRHPQYVEQKDREAEMVRGMEALQRHYDKLGKWPVPKRGAIDVKPLWMEPELKPNEPPVAAYVLLAPAKKRKKLKKGEGHLIAVFVWADGKLYPADLDKMRAEGYEWIECYTVPMDGIEIIVGPATEEQVLNFPGGARIRLTPEADPQAHKTISDALFDYYRSNPEQNIQPAKEVYLIYKVVEMAGVYTDASYLIEGYSRNGNSVGKFRGVWGLVDGKIEPGDSIPTVYYGEPLDTKPR